MHHQKPMTLSRYRHCLAVLNLSQRDLAKLIGCARPLPGLWATGDRTIPPAIGGWLEECVKIRTENPVPPLPKPPRKWRKTDF
jgi:hypothetical protein